MRKKPLCLIIRDGWGKGKDEISNAIFSADTKYTDSFEKKYPTTLLGAEGINVGLPSGSQGNSEVGHLTIGSGRIIYQSLTRIDNAIKDGTFFQNEAFLKAVQVSKEKKCKIHLIGLIQEEGVHSVTHHAKALLDFFKKHDVSDVLVHGLSDGRDTPPRSAKKHFSYLQECIDQAGIGRIASVTGRYYAMDRDKRWDRTEIAYLAFMKGKALTASSWESAIEDAYRSGENDEFIKPRLIDFEGFGHDDVIIFFNFRFDRTRQLTQAIVEPDFKEFETVPNQIHFVTMTHYYDDGHFEEAFSLLSNSKLLGEVLSENGLKQLRCAETEKYAHVTFFFNGQMNDPFANEDRILVNSPKVATYDLKPEMSAFLVRDKLLEAISSDKYDVIMINFANCDMVGHTGVYEAILKAVSTVDQCVYEVVEAVLEKGGIAILSADHGNADQTKLKDGSPMTAHTTNPVQFTMIGAGDVSLHEGGTLADIAPTMLGLLKIPIPEEMSGRNLIKS